MQTQEINQPFQLNNTPPREEEIALEMASELRQVRIGLLPEKPFLDKYAKWISKLESDNAALEIKLAESLWDDLLGNQGFFIRRHFYAQLERVIMEIPRLQKAKPSFKGAAVLMIDTDNFKIANDSYDHNFGDKVLRTVAAGIRQNVRRRSDFFGHEIAQNSDQDDNSDIPMGEIGRHGGDEMVVCLFGTDETGALIVAERIRSTIEHTLIDTPDKRKWRQTVSIGVAVVEPGDSAESLVNKADQAVYLAKSEGKNRVELYQTEN